MHLKKLKKINARPSSISDLKCRQIFSNINQNE